MNSCRDLTVIKEYLNNLKFHLNVNLINNVADIVNSYIKMDQFFQRSECINLDTIDGDADGDIATWIDNIHYCGGEFWVICPNCAIEMKIAPKRAIVVVKNIISYSYGNITMKPTVWSIIILQKPALSKLLFALYERFLGSGSHRLLGLNIDYSKNTALNRKFHKDGMRRDETINFKLSLYQVIEPTLITFELEEFENYR